jgi:SIT4-associating protein SAP185/190
MDRGFNRNLAFDLFLTGRVTERIIEGQLRSDEEQARNNMRLGYMGHLTLVAEEVVKFSERHPPEMLSEAVLDKVTDKIWSDYVENTLAETRERDNAILGGVRPDMAVGPRQAVLNAVNAATGFSGSQSAALTNAGLNGGGGGGAAGLDSMDLGGSSSSNAGFLGGSGSGSLLSGFGSSSDEEDEDMEEIQEREERESSGAGVGGVGAGSGSGSGLGGGGGGEGMVGGGRRGSNEGGGGGGSSSSDQVGHFSFEDVDMSDV